VVKKTRGHIVVLFEDLNQPPGQRGSSEKPSLEVEMSEDGTTVYRGNSFIR
jgi:hypothetical protein